MADLVRGFQQTRNLTSGAKARRGRRTLNLAAEGSIGPRLLTCAAILSMTRRALLSFGEFPRSGTHAAKGCTLHPSIAIPPQQIPWRRSNADSRLTNRGHRARAQGSPQRNPCAVAQLSSVEWRTHSDATRERVAIRGSGRLPPPLATQSWATAGAHRREDSHIS